MSNRPKYPSTGPGQAPHTVDYVYALDGSQKTVTDYRGITTSNYDDMGRLEGVEFPSWERSGVGPISYGYDNAGNRTSVTTPSGTVTYTFDELNRLETATDPATGTTTYTYDDVGNLKTITYPNETIAEYTYDALNRLTYLENRTSGGTVISSYAYTLDAAGNRTKVVEHTGRIVEYEYDDTYKLREEKITNPDSSVSVISYTYDKVGNRKTKTEDGFTTTYTYNDNNQLVTEDDITYRYDDNGNLKAKNSAEEQIEYFYDAENHLIRVETTRFGVTIVVEYEYDDEGNRVRKVIDNTVITNYLVDSNRDYAQVLEERDGNGALLVRYVYGHDLISQTRDGATSYYHYDGLGSTRALTSSAEAVTDTYNYDAFGNLLDKTGTTTNTYLFTGEFFDTHIGFYYLRARYMSPAIGRFVTMDTFAGSPRDPYSLHKYLYANANPVMNIDPSGYRSGYVEQEGVSAGVGILSKINIAIIRTTAALQILATKTIPVIFIDPNRLILVLILLETAYELTETLELLEKSQTQLDPNSDEDEEGKDYLVRVQAQGNWFKDKKKSKKGERYITIARNRPVKAREVFIALTALAKDLTKTERGWVNQAFVKASKWVKQVRDAGGIGPIGSRSFNNEKPYVDPGNARIDIDIVRGEINLVP